MATATVTFERVGRHHAVPPLTVDSDDPDVIAEAVYKHARPHLSSNAVQVHVDLGAGTVLITAGFHNAGGGTVEVIPMKCRICSEQIRPEGNGWMHVHTGEAYCGCGDGSTATPPEVSR